MPRLRVLAGPSIEEVVPISANSDVPVDIHSDAFEGKVAVYVKGFADADGVVGDSPYFKKRTTVTWSIQVQGRFLRPYSADEILFGNTFERPLKLPWGFGAALKFMNCVDPTLEQDLTSNTRPWALSPLIATMPYLQHRRLESETKPPAFPPDVPIENDISQLALMDKNGAKSKELLKDRRSYFCNAAHRKDVVFGPEDLITADFCHDYLRFSAHGVCLRLPGGITIDMMKYWDGQPVRFVCCQRINDIERSGGQPWGRVFWCVVIEPVEDDDDVGEDEAKEDID
ncbi:uncharacterized protein FIBRA_00215 [Fibroporia radiculosa]|uniref:Domain of unknown function at the cortex 1 domain-containing protein n=1 Tax=Fibroporia radiculosa TaxID=599839 RepID=J7SBY0_9APHY|nr:uncharacterized protein FIBRA_00215 [Fibroporia radiculosa]CCL98221.1 predicted protein [Fibroporia radiculosa]